MTTESTKGGLYAGAGGDGNSRAMERRASRPAASDWTGEARLCRNYRAVPPGLDFVPLLLPGTDVLVVDSVAALVPKAELDGEMGDSHMGLQARLMSQALRKLTGTVAKSRTCLIFINQIREKIGVMFGNPETTTGGRALKFYSSVRIDIRRIAAIKEGDVVTGSRTRVKIVKNKVAAPFRESEFDILYGEGISREGDLIDLAVNNNILEKSGSWFSYKGERIGQGRENARSFLKENKDTMAKLDAEVRKALGMIPAAASATPAAVPAQATGTQGRVTTMPTAAEAGKVPARR